MIDGPHAGEIAATIKERYKENKLLHYRPCCRAHKNVCPAFPCPDSKHTKFHQSEKRIRIILGSNRSGKSYACLAEMLMTCSLMDHPFKNKKNPIPGRFRIFESDFGVIEKLIIPMVIDLIPKQSLFAYDAKKPGESKWSVWENSYDPKYHILKLKGGSLLDFMSYDQDASKAESVELDCVMADEEMPENIYAATLARLISRNGKFFMGVTPLYDFSWGMKFLETMDPQVEVFHFDIYDNPHLSEQAVIEFEASVPEHEKEARIHGRFMELQGLVYKELRPDIHLLGDDQPKSEYPVIFTMDPHPRKATVMTWAYVSPKEDVVFFDELEMTGSARDMATAIRSKEFHHPSKPRLRLIDPAAKGQGSNFSFETDTLREFEREGLNFSLADNSEAGYNIVHEYLTFNPALPVGSFNRPRCFFTKNAPKTWFGMTHLMWDEWSFQKSMRDQKERIKDYKKDFPDCVRYTLAQRPTMRSFYNVKPRPLGNIANMQNFSQERNYVRGVVLGRTV